MSPKFNIDRPKISDEEINKHKDFDKLVQQFKRQSLQKARSDQSWWKDKKVRYSTVIAGIAVVCTITYLALFNTKTSHKTTHETLTTQQLNKENTNPANKKPFIASPSSNLRIPYSSYKVNSQKGGELTHHTSSKIKIPKNSFVDKNGKDVIGDVTIEYREIHGPAEIIASGIPMSYDSAGVKNTLSSAGMFDIIGTQNGEPVYIKPGKDISVELASETAEDKYNQYFLDTVEKNWTYLKRDHPVSAHTKSNGTAHFDEEATNEKSNKQLTQLKKDIEQVLPKKIDSVKVVYTKKVNALPIPKSPNAPKKPSGKQTFNIDADPKEYPELAGFKNLVFEIGDENKNYTPEMNQITWNDIQISQGPAKGKNYLLTLVQGRRTEKLIVYPVLSGSDFEKAENLFEKNLEIYNGLREKREAEEKRLIAEMEAKQKTYMQELAAKQKQYDEMIALTRANRNSEAMNDLTNNYNKLNFEAKARRIFNISSFGIYNSDCAVPLPSSNNIAPIFISSVQSKPLAPHQVFLVDHNSKTVRTFTSNDLGSVGFNPASENSFVVFVKNRIYLCERASFKSSTENNSNKFTVKELPESSDNLSDLKKALDS